MEDTRHYLLNCIRYRDIRQEMMTTVSSIFSSSLFVLLFGNAMLSRLENITIFIAVQKFIKKSKQFTGD